MNKQVLLKIRGQVQGVFFRVNAQEQAEKLGLTGWVRNTESEIVEILAEGEEEKLKQFIKWCYNGSELAEVSKIELKWKKAEDRFKQFKINY